MVGCLLVSRFPLACELADHHELAGHPVAVATDDGSVLATSPAAEASGVRPDQKLREAIGRCPTLAVLNGRPAHYQAQAEAILRALELVAFTVEQEAQGMVYVDLAELRTCYPSLDAIITALLACVPAALEPRLGAAPTRFPALLAARTAPAGGSMLVSEGDLAGFLASQPVEALPVSAEMLRRLRLLKLGTLGELGALRRSALAAQFGPEGTLAWELAHGVARSPLRRRPRLIQVVEWLRLETPLVSHPAILAAWEQTLSRALRQPAFRGHAARQAELRGTTERGGHWERTVTFKEALADLRRMWAALRSVLDVAQFPGPLSELAVELKGLTDTHGQQLALPDARSAMRERLEESLRQLKARYGYCPVGRVVEMEPWSRVPERRLGLIDFDP
jgi:nucleotidyltransferase/DNA polymerase involved in DNA repair